MSGWFSVPDWENTPGGGKSPATAVAPSGLKSNKKKNQKPNKVAAPNPQPKTKPQPVIAAPSAAGQFVRPPKATAPTTTAAPKKAAKRKPEVSAKSAQSDASLAKKPKLQTAAKAQDVKAKVKPGKKDAKVQQKSEANLNGKAKSLSNPSNEKKTGKNIAKPTKEIAGKPKQKPNDKLNGHSKSADSNPFEPSKIKPLKSPKKKPAKPAKKLQLAAEDSDTELAAEVNLFRKKLLKGFTGPLEVGPPNPNAKFSDDDDDLGLSDSEEESGPRQKKSKKAAEAKKVAAENAAKSALNAKQQSKAKKTVAEPAEEDGETAPELVAIAGVGAGAAASANSSFRDKLIGNLKGSRFRFLNEQLYSSDGKAAVKLFKEDRAAFTAYHEGYRQQVQQWPLNPLDRIIKAIKKLPKTLVVADFGCGEGRLAKAVPNKTYSLDLVAQRHEIIACDMAKTPLETGSIDVAVYCLSLMGTNLRDFILEANRVLKMGGQLKIAEVESRFEDVRQFVDNIKSCGFQHVNTDTSSKFFVFLNFKKVHAVDKNNRQVPAFSLKPCLYKKR